MSHTFARNYLHITFSTRGRRKLIPAELQPNLFAYVRGIARHYDIDLLAIGGREEHLHLLLAVPPKLALADAVRALKANSSKGMNESRHGFSWQEGYAAFSVSTSNLEPVSAYIRNQAEHDKKRTFEEEFAAFLSKNGISFDSEHAFG